MQNSDHQETQNQPELSEELNYSLCLSGGGFRATLFHLGVIHALRSRQIGNGSILENIKEIYSVSGGSILAAHMVKNWDRYCGENDEFNEVTKELSVFAKRDVRGRVLRRWFLSIFPVLPRALGLKRTFWLEREYKNIFGNETFEDCQKSNTNLPNLHLLATSFNTGQLCSFSNNNFEIRKEKNTENNNNEPKYETKTTTAGLVSLKFAVTASSAFPPLFPPVKLKKNKLGDPNIEGVSFPIYLSDGGVFDNLGLIKFSANRDISQSQNHTLLMSNASASLNDSTQNSYKPLISRNIRASDIMMQQVTDLIIQNTNKQINAKVISINIKDTVDNSPIEKGIQEKIKKIRTDLDNFNEIEIETLIRHGYDVCNQALGALGTTHNTECEPQSTTNRDQQNKIIEKAEKRKLLPWNSSDPTSWILATIIIVFVAGIGFVSKSAYNEQESATDVISNLDQSEKRIKELETKLAKLREKLPKAIPQPDITNIIDKSNYKIWIQFAGFNRKKIIDLVQTLNKSWSDIPGAKRGGERTPKAAKKNEVRYGPEADHAAADRLAKDINKTNILKTKLKPRKVNILSPGSLEIWISR